LNSYDEEVAALAEKGKRTARGAEILDARNQKPGKRIGQKILARNTRTRSDRIYSKSCIFLPASRG